jgi:3-hydroxyacyl-CoA dehydrogenase / enoyl-CoA hydratase / 3-hydroxybutyryl-CoA epimerase
MTSQPPPSSQDPGPFLDFPGGGIAHLRFDDPGRRANILAEPVMRRLASRLEEIREGTASGVIRGLLVISGKPDGFIAGADVDAIARVEGPEEGAEAARLGQAIYLELEALGIPTVAAIQGACVGGGMELALACRYRVASDHPKTRLGLPEVQLGILPAWGGTTRLPRLVGLQDALDLLLTGRLVDPKRARRMGLVDAILPAPLFLEAASDFLRHRVEGLPLQPRRKRSLGRRLLEDTAPGRRIVLAKARASVLERTGGHYPAPLRILDVVRRSLGAPVERALALEAEAAGELIASPVCRNLIHVFHLREAARKGEGIPVLGDAAEVRRVGVVGAGVMGGGVAHLMADHGIEVRVKDIRHEAVGGALLHARELFRKGVERRRLTRLEADQRMERISGGLDYGGFGRLDLVVEAVVERMEVKRAVLREVEEHVPAHCILTTNTSTLRVDGMASVLARPEHLVGMHFFNPVDRMPLVEVIRGKASSDAAVATVYRLAVRTGKVPVVVNDGPGFLVNRILGPYLNEAGHLLAEGGTVEEIDAAARVFGMPMGPLRLMDEVGIDVVRHAGDVLHAAFGSRLDPAPPLLALRETDRLGRKGGLGFYRYEKGKEVGVDPGIYEVLGRSVPPARTPLEPREIRARLVLAMANEATRILEDRIVSRAADVDLGMIMGTGFPPFRGGLLRYVDALHPRTVLDRLQEYAVGHGERFRPAPLLRELVEADERFYERFPSAAGAVTEVR